MTIKEALAYRKGVYIKTLESCNAPKIIIDHQKASDGYSHITGIDKYGDLEILNTEDITPKDDPLYYEIVIFHCENCTEILKVTRFKDEIPAQLPTVSSISRRSINVSAPYQLETVLIRLAYWP